MSDLVKMTLSPEWLKQNKLRLVGFRKPNEGEMCLSCTEFELYFLEAGKTPSEAWGQKRFVVCPIESKMYPNEPPAPIVTTEQKIEPVENTTPATSIPGEEDL